MPSSIIDMKPFINQFTSRTTTEAREAERPRIRLLIEAILADYRPNDVVEIHANVLATGILYEGLESRFKLTEMALREALRSRGYSEDAIKQVVKRVEEEVKAMGAVSRDTTTSRYRGG